MIFISSSFTVHRRHSGKLQKNDEKWNGKKYSQFSQSLHNIFFPTLIKNVQVRDERKGTEEQYFFEDAENFVEFAQLLLQWYSLTAKWLQQISILEKRAKKKSVFFLICENIRRQFLFLATEEMKKKNVWKYLMMMMSTHRCWFEAMQVKFGMKFLTAFRLSAIGTHSNLKMYF